MTYVVEAQGVLLNEAGEEQPLKAGDFAMVNPDEKHQYRNKGDKPFKMICGVPKEFEYKDFLKESDHWKIRIQFWQAETRQSGWFRTISGLISDLLISACTGILKLLTSSITLRAS